MRCFCVERDGGPDQGENKGNEVEKDKECRHFDIVKIENEYRVNQRCILFEELHILLLVVIKLHKINYYTTL